MNELSSVALMFDSNDQLQVPGKIIRNRLNLSQRIDVLRRYTKTPDIGLLAEEFKCGRRQIKNILRKRKKYVTMWSRNRHRYDEEPVPEATDDRTSVFSDAVGFVLHEWVERARCYQININDDILRNFAKEISQHIKFQSFDPTNDWLKNFKQKYSLVGVNLNIKQEKGTEPLIRKPLSIGKIIADLKRDYGESAVPIADAEAAEVPLLVPVDQNANEPQRKKKPPKSMVSESGDSAMQMDNDDFNDAESYAKAPRLSFARQIRTYRDALNQLGPLEQFALFNEHVRAVGLINQLETIFREEMVKEGFE